jgi:hypothetical protein
MGITEVPMSIEYGSTGPRRQDNQSVWLPQEVAPMEEKKYNGFKVFGVVLFIVCTLYLLV